MTEYSSRANAFGAAWLKTNNVVLHTYRMNACKVGILKKNTHTHTQTQSVFVILVQSIARFHFTYSEWFEYMMWCDVIWYDLICDQTKPMVQHNVSNNLLGIASHRFVSHRIRAARFGWLHFETHAFTVGFIRHKLMLKSSFISWILGNLWRLPA